MDEKIKKESACAISLKLLGVFIVMFLLGIVTDQIVLNALSKEISRFSTISLIGFMLSVLMAGASIVLAITAILLGRKAEQTMVERSDESIRLQSEIFLKTTETLQKVASSTGVTEKRIEDIIAGRAHTIAEIASEKSKTREEIEDDIKVSLLKAVKSDTSSKNTELLELEKRKEEREKQNVIYQKYHKRLLDSFSKKEGLRLVKRGHGIVGAKGDDQIDSIFIGENFKLGVCTFRNKFHSKYLNQFFSIVMGDLTNGNFEHIITVSFDKKEKYKFDDKAKKILSHFKPELTNKITFKSIAFDEIDSFVDSFDVAKLKRKSI